MATSLPELIPVALERCTVEEIRAYLSETGISTNCTLKSELVEIATAQLEKKYLDRTQWTIAALRACLKEYRITPTAGASKDKLIMNLSGLVSK